MCVLCVYVYECVCCVCTCVCECVCVRVCACVLSPPVASLRLPKLLQVQRIITIIIIIMVMVAVSGPWSTATALANYAGAPDVAPSRSTELSVALPPGLGPGGQMHGEQKRAAGEGGGRDPQPARHRPCPAPHRRWMETPTLCVTQLPNTPGGGGVPATWRTKRPLRCPRPPRPPGPSGLRLWTLPRPVSLLNRPSGLQAGP